MQYDFIINNDRLFRAKRNNVYTGNVNYYECDFTFTEDWNGLHRFLACMVGNTCYTTEIIDNVCIIPTEAFINIGCIQLGVYGTNLSPTDLKRISTNWISLFVDPGAYETDVTTPIPPTPDLWEQYVTKMDNAIRNAVPIIGDNGNWWTWNTDGKAYTDSGYVSKGDKGDKGDTPQKGVDYFTEQDIESLGIDTKADKADTYTKTEMDTALNTKADKQNEYGGFEGGISASANTGFAGGAGALTIDGGAVGDFAKSIDGGAVGDGAMSSNGGAVGRMAITSNGFAGGDNAKTVDDALPIDAIQLGTGTNPRPKTLQIYQHTLMNADGNIPDARIPQLTAKADKADVYTKTESDDLLATKVDKVDGKGLSTNDYTATDKSKVNQLPETIATAPIKSWSLIEDYTVSIEEGIAKYNITFPAGAKYSEVYIEVANMITVPATTDTITVRLGAVGLEVWRGTMRGKNYTAGIHNPQFSAHVTISPTGLLAASATASKFSYALEGTSFRIPGTGALASSNYSEIDSVYFQVFDYPMASGTRIRVYGR